MRRIVTVEPAGSKGVARTSPRSTPPTFACWHPPDVVVAAGSNRPIAARTVSRGWRRRCAMRKILVGTDTSASADLAVGEAARLAGQSGAERLVLHVRPELSIRDEWTPKSRRIRA